MNLAIETNETGWWFWFVTLLFILLLLGTTMVTFTGRCFLALMLKKMPWNKGLTDDTHAK